MTRVDVHGDHGGARVVGDDVPATEVDKIAKQQRNKHYSIETKPKVHQSRATAHRRALATERSVVAVLRPALRKKTACGDTGLLEAKQTGQE